MRNCSLCGNESDNEVILIKQDFKGNGFTTVSKISNIAIKGKNIPMCKNCRRAFLYGAQHGVLVAKRMKLEVPFQVVIGRNIS